MDVKVGIIDIWLCTSRCLELQVNELSVTSVISQVNLLFFAKSRELTGASQTEIALPVSATGKQLFGCIVSIFPRLG